MGFGSGANRGGARRLGRPGGGERRGACANVYPHIDSFYWWQGELVEDHEAVVILKTRRARVPELIAAVRSWHSYSVPAILVLEVRDGNPDYLRWLAEETAGERPGASG
ncbi:MAG: divalent-cation tolerance protein CutA [Bacillota bacterium]|nr:MAG: divalent-cation tolerance protein CutA [Bacillota bacterium]